MDFDSCSQPPVMGLALSQEALWQSYESSFSMLPRALERLMRFRKHDYWINTPSENIHALLVFLKKHRNEIDAKNPVHRALAIDLLTLFAMSLLQMAMHVFQINPENAESEMKAYFYGGYQEQGRKQAIIESLTRLAEESSGQGTLFETGKIALDPDYLQNLL